MQNYQCRGKSYRDIDNFAYHKKPNAIIVLLYISRQILNPIICFTIDFKPKTINIARKKI